MTILEKNAFNEGVKNTQTFNKIIQILPLPEAGRKLVKLMPCLKRKEIPKILREIITSAKMNYAHEIFYTPSNYEKTSTAEPDAWTIIKGKLVPVEIKCTIQIGFYLDRLKRKGKFCTVGQLKCLDDKGWVKFWAVYNSAADEQKITGNASKLTLCVVFDGDDGFGLELAFAAFMPNTEIKEQLTDGYDKGKKRFNGGKDFKWVRNGNTVTAYIPIKDIIFFNKQWNKNSFAA